MKRLLFVLLLVLAPPCCAADPPAPTPALPAVVLPDGPPAPVPVPTPPSPNTPQKLSSDQLYIIQAQVKCVVLTSPPGLVTLSSEPGPIKIKAKFVDGDGTYQCRLFKAPFIYVLEAKVTGLAELIVVPAGATEADIVRRSLDVSGVPVPPGPTPPIPPGPGPTPPIPPGPAPIPADGNRVLMIYETSEETKYPAAQLSVLYSKSVRDYLDSRCAVGADGKTKEWRIWDKDVDASAETKLWQDALARKRDSTPWIIISNGKTGFEGPLPANVTDAMTLLKKYLGG